MLILSRHTNCDHFRESNKYYSQDRWATVHENNKAWEGDRYPDTLFEKWSLIYCTCSAESLDWQFHEFTRTNSWSRAEKADFLYSKVSVFFLTIHLCEFACSERGREQSMRCKMIVSSRFLPSFRHLLQLARGRYECKLRVVNRFSSRWLRYLGVLYMLCHDIVSLYCRLNDECTLSRIWVSLRRRVTVGLI